MTPLTSDFLSSSVVFLSAAVIAVPLAQRAGLGSVLGYLLAGIAIGPWGLGLIRDVQAIMHFAEFGVVLLLFLIGLELNPKKLWNLRGPILGLGGAQVVVTTAVLSSVAYLLGVSWQSALVIGMALALSSTAIALRVIEEHGLTRTEAGQSGFAVLLFQDIAVIPMLALLPILAGNSSGDWLNALWMTGGIAALLLGGHFLLNPLVSIHCIKWRARTVYCRGFALGGWHRVADAEGWSFDGARYFFSWGDPRRKRVSS